MIGYAWLHADHRYTFMGISRSVDRLSHHVQMQLHIQEAQLRLGNGWRWSLEASVFPTPRHYVGAFRLSQIRH